MKNLPTSLLSKFPEYKNGFIFDLTERDKVECPAKMKCNPEWDLEVMFFMMSIENLENEKMIKDIAELIDFSKNIKCIIIIQWKKENLNINSYAPIFDAVRRNKKIQIFAFLYNCF